jgi:hypothetical protein
MAGTGGLLLSILLRLIHHCSVNCLSLRIGHAADILPGWFRVSFMRKGKGSVAVLDTVFESVLQF